MWCWVLVPLKQSRLHELSMMDIQKVLASEPVRLSVEVVFSVYGGSLSKMTIDLGLRISVSPA